MRARRSASISNVANRQDLGDEPEDWSDTRRRKFDVSFGIIAMTHWCGATLALASSGANACRHVPASGNQAGSRCRDGGNGDDAGVSHRRWTHLFRLGHKLARPIWRPDQNTSAADHGQCHRIIGRSTVSGTRTANRLPSTMPESGPSAAMPASADRPSPTSSARGRQPA